MQRHEQDVIAGGLREQADPDNRLTLQIEWTMDLFGDCPGQLIARPIGRGNLLEIDGSAVVYARDGLSVGLDVVRAQDAMTIDQRLKRAAKGGHVDVDRTRHVQGTCTRRSPAPGGAAARAHAGRTKGRRTGVRPCP